MVYHLKVWQKTIGPHKQKILFGISLFLFFSIQIYLFLQLKAEHFYHLAKEKLSYIEKLDNSLIIKKISLYHNTLDLLDKATGLNPLDADYYFIYAKTLLEIFSHQEIMDVMELKGIKNKDEFINFLEFQINKAITLNPLNASYYLLSGYASHLKGNIKDVQIKFRRAYLLDPHNISNIIYISRFFLNNNKLDDALYYREKVEKICSDISYSFDACKELENLKEKLP
jgi:tetratricopeptide (TPR) repeat protein